MRFWNNSAKRAKLTHAKGDDYYFSNPQSGMTYRLRKDLNKTYHFEIRSKNEELFDEWETSRENVDILLEKIHEFKKEVENAKQEKDGFTAVRFPQLRNFCLYYRRLGRSQYQFILVEDEEKERVCTLKDTPNVLIADFFNLLLSQIRERDYEPLDETLYKAQEIFPDEKSPLYLSAKEHDEYLAAEIAYFFGEHTREVVDRINAERKEPVFLVEKEIYDVGDITEIQGVERGPIRFLNRRTHYHLQVFIRDRFYKVTWEPIKKALRMN